ncbi:DUF4145 domain-containing protein [Leptolyngbya sp. FACHB-1515]
MDIVADYSMLTPPDDECYSFPEEGYCYQLLLCLACSEVTLRRYFYREYYEFQEYDEFEDVTFETLYPSSNFRLSGLPDRIQHSYEVSLKVRPIDPNAYAVLLGRILEMVCEDRKASGNSLQKKLEDLAVKREIPDRLVAVAHNLRQLRNVGAHASLVELTRDEVPILDDLCKAILEYVYTIPHLIDKAEQRLKRLKEKGKDADSSD